MYERHGKQDGPLWAKSTVYDARDLLGRLGVTWHASDMVHHYITRGICKRHPSGSVSYDRGTKTDVNMQIKRSNGVHPPCQPLQAGRGWEYETLVVHAGRDRSPAHGECTVPIYNSASFKFPTSAAAKDAFRDVPDQQRWVYSRFGNVSQCEHKTLHGPISH